MKAWNAGTFTCPTCRTDLICALSSTGELELYHPRVENCANSKKRYMAPSVLLKEIKQQ